MCPSIFDLAAWKKKQAALENKKRNKIVWKKMEAVDFELEKVLIIL